MSPKRSRTVEALLTGAERAFAERGFHGASIGYICQCAGRTTGAFYSNYDSKLTLFLDVYRRHGDQTATRLADRLADVETHLARTCGAGAAPELARTLAELISTGFDDRWLFLVIEFRLMALRDEAAAAALVEHEDRFRRAVGDLLEALFTRMVTLMGGRPALDGYELAAFLLSMTRGLKLDRAVHASVGSCGPLAFDTLVTVLEGLFAPVPAVRPTGRREAAADH